MSRLLQKIITATGLLRLWRFVMRKRVVILYLHGVMDDEVDSSWSPLRRQYSRQQLRQALRLLSKSYNFVSIDTARKMLAGEVSPMERCMVLTFDDGYLNNWKHAAPILREFGVPTVFYIATGNVEKREPFWVDRLDYAIQAAVKSDTDVVIDGQPVTLQAGSRDELVRTFKKMRDLAKAVDRSDEEMRAEIDSITSRLESKSGAALDDIFEDDDWAGVMTWQDVKNASDDELITIGSHTVDHVRLGEVEDARASDELTQSKSIIESKTGQECQHFCYPNGSFNRRTASLVEAAGYKTAVTVETGINRVGENPMQLRRIHLPDTEDDAQVEYVASGLSDAIAKLRKRFRRT